MTEISNSGELARLDVPEVLDLGEDGDVWAIAGHWERTSALAAVVAHLVALGVDVADTVEWVGGLESLDVTHKRGSWSDDDPAIDGSRWQDDDAGDAWTFVA